MNRSPSPPVIDLAPDQWTPGEVDDLDYEPWHERLRKGRAFILGVAAAAALILCIGGTIIDHQEHARIMNPPACPPFQTYLCGGYNP